MLLDECLKPVTRTLGFLRFIQRLFLFRLFVLKVFLIAYVGLGERLVVGDILSYPPNILFNPYLCLCYVVRAIKP
jgi:hypothetical protein